MSCLNPRCLPSYLKHSNHCTRRTILVSVRSFPWGNCGKDSSWVWRDQERAQIARLSRFWQTLPAPRRAVAGPEELPSGIPGGRWRTRPRGSCRFPRPGVGVGGGWAPTPVRFSLIRSAAGGGSPSLHTSPYMHRLHQPALLQPHK